MLDSTSSLTVQARLPNPYVHVDNRGLILCNGPRCVCIPASGLRACAETLEIIATEKRATRTQGQHLVGGYIDGGYVVLYAGTQDDLVSVSLNTRSSTRCARRSRGEAAPGCRSRSLVLAAPASAEEKLLTLYSPPIDSEPYVHKSTTVTLKADGVEAPAEPGYVLGFAEQVLVDSKDPDAEPLPVSKMMVHHLLYFTGGRTVESMGCLGPQFLGGRGEEHPDGQFAAVYPPSMRARYGVHNVNGSGAAPEWSVTAMVMNHYQRSKRFYVRTKVWYTTEPREDVYPTTIGNCKHLLNGMAYDVPGGGGTYHRPLDVDGALQRPHPRRRLAPPRRRDAPDARLEDLQPRAARRQGLLRRGRPPVQHDPPDPARAGADRQRHLHVRAGPPDRRRRGARTHRAARQLDAARGGDGLLDPQPRARRLGDPLRAAADRPDRGHEAGEVRPQGALRLRPRGAAALQAVRALARRSARVLPVGDQYFRSPRVTAKVGERITWRFAGVEPHSVTVANGPRGFSSNYLGQVAGEYSFAPTVPGTYRLTCLIHPTTMGQTLKVARWT